MVGHSSLRSDSECWTDGSDKVLNHHPSDSSVKAAPCGVCWLPGDLFLHQAWVKYLLISLTFFFVLTCLKFQMGKGLLYQNGSKSVW